MSNADLYERIKDADITEVSKDLFYQIERKGHTRHKIIGSYKQHLHLYGFDFEDSGLPHNISYRQFKEKHPDKFKINMGVIKECVDAGFKI